MLSVLNARSELDVSLLTTESESHVTRARNNLVARFMAETDFQTLAFIDSDIAFDVQGFARLAAMSGVRGAAVACKTPDYTEHLSVYPRIARADMPSEPFEVDFLGSAYLMVDRTVFESLIASGAVNSYTDPIIGQAWDFFRDGVDGDDWLSEDYGFCKLLNEQGIPVVCEPSVVVAHYGSACWLF